MCKCRIGWPDSYWGYSDCFCQTLCVIDWKIIFLKYSPSFKFTISPSHFYDYETVTVHALLLPIHGHHLVALYVFLLREARGHKIVIASDTFWILRFLVMRNPHDQRSRLRFRIPALPPPQSRNAPKQWNTEPWDMWWSVQVTKSPPYVHFNERQHNELLTMYHTLKGHINWSLGYRSSLFLGKMTSNLFKKILHHIIRGVFYLPFNIRVCITLYFNDCLRSIAQI